MLVSLNRAVIPAGCRRTTAFVNNNMRIHRFDFSGSPPTTLRRRSSLSALSSSDEEFSQRGLDAVGLLPSYLADAREVECYSSTTCPDGALQLGVAENKMLSDLLVPSLNQFGSNTFTEDCIYYQPTHGRLETRKAMANYLERTLDLSRKMDVNGITVGAGCNAVLENLCFCLASAGDAVLIPTPYYAAFEFDLVARAGLSIQPVTTFAHHPSIHIDDSSSAIPAEAYFPNRSALNAAHHKSRQEGHEPRILLLSHPNNPLGICYPPHVVKECIDWCRENKVHLVSDEIYAGSVYGHGANFQSAMELASGEAKSEYLGLGPYVHLVYALSKDFALSGLRVGACYSENEKTRLPMQKLNDLCQISSQTQILVENMLSAKDDDKGEFWTTTFLQQAHERILKRCNALQSLLKKCGIPYLPADSGLFVWMDFRQFLSNEEDPTQEEMERKLYLELVHDFGLLFTPGLSMRNERPGFFRCVFTAATDEEFALGLERIEKFCNAKK